MEFAIYVHREGWRQFTVALYEISVRDGKERFRVSDTVFTIRRKTALKHGQALADAFANENKKTAVIFSMRKVGT